MAAKPIFVQAVDTNGTPYSGAKLNVYDAGTTTPRAIYTESGLGTASANPAIADANGVVVVWVNDAGGDIKVTLTNSAETVTPHNEDNVPIASLTCYPVITFQGDQSLLTTSSPTFAGLTLGNVSFAGVVTDPNADRLVFWDDSAGQVNFMTLGTGLAFNGTALELDGDLQDISGLTPTDGGVIIGDGTDFVVESGATLRTSIGVAIGSDVQAWDADLDVYAANPLTAAELGELQNIGSTTINATQWGYVGGLDQALATTDSPTFATVTSTSSVINGVTVSPSGATLGQALGFPNSTSTLEPYTPAGGGDTLAAVNETISGDWNYTGAPTISGSPIVSRAATETLTNKTLTSPAINGALSGDAFLDEDEMGSDSATKTLSQQSAKAYNDNQRTSTYTTLKAMTAGLYTSVIVEDAARGGTFVWTSGDQSANITADTSEGVWVPPDSDNTGASGAWKRTYDGVLDLRWFGAVSGGSAAANATALAAAESFGARAIKVKGGAYDINADLRPTTPLIYEGGYITKDGVEGNFLPDSSIDLAGFEGQRTANMYGFKYIAPGDLSSSNPGDGSYYSPEWANQLRLKMTNDDGFELYSDGGSGTDGAITASGTTFTSASAAFVAGDVGDTIMVAGAGDSGGPLISTIASRTSATEIELTTAAGATVSGAQYNYGTGTASSINQVYLNLTHRGQNDCYTLFQAVSASNLRNITPVEWGSQPSAGMQNGQNNATTSKVNLYGYGDIVLNDNSHQDVALLGNVSILYNDGGDSGDYNIPRNASLMLSSGSNDIDAHYTASGRAKVGLDLSRGTFSQSALTLKQGQKVSWDAVSTVPQGKYSTQDAGTVSSSFDGTHIIDDFNGTSVCKRSASEFLPATTVKMDGNWLYFDADDDTGFSSTTDDQLDIRCAGANRGYFNATQFRWTSQEVYIDSAGNAYFYIDRGTNNNRAEFLFRTAGSTKWVNGLVDADSFLNQPSGVTVSGDDYYINKTSTNGYYLYFDADGDIYLGNETHVAGAVDTDTGYEVNGAQVVGAQGAAVADTTITYTANDPAITPDDAVTIADGSAPTNSELLELCVELKNQIETLKGRLEAHGLIVA